MRKKALNDPDRRDQTAILQEAGRLFALAGGFRKPGTRIDLSAAIWVCRSDAGARLALPKGGHNDLP